MLFFHFFCCWLGGWFRCERTCFDWRWLEPFNSLSWSSCLVTNAIFININLVIQYWMWVSDVILKCHSFTPLHSPVLYLSISTSEYIYIFLCFGYLSKPVNIHDAFSLKGAIKYLMPTLWRGGMYSIFGVSLSAIAIQQFFEKEPIHKRCCKFTGMHLREKDLVFARPRPPY